MESVNSSRMKYKPRQNPSIKARLVKAVCRRNPVAGEKTSIPGEKKHVASVIPAQLHDLVWEEAEGNGDTVGTVISHIYNSVDSITAEDLQIQQVLDNTADKSYPHCYLATMVPVEDYQKFKLKAEELGLSMRLLLKLLIRKRNGILRVDATDIDAKDV